MARIELVEITGLAQAITELKISKKNYNQKEHHRIMKMIKEETDYRGFIKNNNPKFELNELCNKVAKWGAGVDLDVKIDAGHDVLLRDIDICFITHGLHRGGQDDLDSHAKRFDNRIVRESTRLATFDDCECSEWYLDKIKSTNVVLNELGVEVPKEYTDKNGINWIYVSNGYVRKPYVDDKDVLRGNYPLSIPSTASWKINLHDLRHVYMRRNVNTHAHPELTNLMESLADQIEKAIPNDLGKLIRYDYAYNLETDKNELCHISKIIKCTKS